MYGNEDVIQRYASFDLPPLQSNASDDDGQLSPDECRERDHYRDINRRNAWIAGRRLGKQLITEVLEGGVDREKSSTSHRTHIEILSRDEQGRGVRPVVTIDGELFPQSLSISHSTRGVLVGLATRPEVAVGVDLVIPGEVRPRSLRTWFTAGERDRFDPADSLESATVWAIKEAVYKACHKGDSFAPRQIEVFRCPVGSFSCHYRGDDLGSACQIQTGEIDGHVVVSVAASNSSQNGYQAHDHSPVCLKVI